MRTILSFCARIFLFVGPCFLVIALGFALHTSMFLHQSVSATGTVVRLAPQRANNQVNFAPVFSFLAAGTSYTVTADVASNPPAFRVGQSVPVLYQTTAPSHAKIASFGQLWLLAVIFGFVGAFMSAFGYALRQFTRSRGRRGVATFA
jgi:hypothetical protein